MVHTMKSKQDPGKASRRSHDRAFKEDLVRQSLEPGASVSAIALRNGVNANMLFKWRGDHRSDRRHGGTGGDGARHEQRRLARRAPQEAGSLTAAQPARSAGPSATAHRRALAAWPPGRLRLPGLRVGAARDRPGRQRSAGLRARQLPRRAARAAEVGLQRLQGQSGRPRRLPGRSTA